MKNLLTIENLAESWQVTTRTIHNYKNHEGLPYKKLGNSIRFDPDEVDEWLKTKSK